MLRNGGANALLVKLGDKMMKRALLFVLISLGSVLCCATPVSASNWVLVRWWGGSIFYVDTQSIKRDGNLVTAWVQKDSTKDKTVESYELVAQIEFDCARRTMLTLYSTERFRKKPPKVLDFSALWDRVGSPVEPDTAGESELDFVCSR